MIEEYEAEIEQYKQNLAYIQRELKAKTEELESKVG